jgi:hypothetical protein
LTAFFPAARNFKIISAIRISNMNAKREFKPEN